MSKHREYVLVGSRSGRGEFPTEMRSVLYYHEVMLLLSKLSFFFLQAEYKKKETTRDIYLSL